MEGKALRRLNPPVSSQGTGGLWSAFNAHYHKAIFQVSTSLASGKPGSRRQADLVLRRLFSDLSRKGSSRVYRGGEQRTDSLHYTVILSWCPVQSQREDGGQGDSCSRLWRRNKGSSNVRGLLFMLILVLRSIYLDLYPKWRWKIRTHVLRWLRKF